MSLFAVCKNKFLMNPYFLYTEVDYVACDNGKYTVNKLCTK